MSSSRPPALAPKPLKKAAPYRIGRRALIAKAKITVALPHGAPALAKEVQRLVWRIDFVRDQLDAVGQEIRAVLDNIEEAKYLATIPGIGWATVAGIISEVGPIDRYENGRQLIKLAGTNPGRKQTGTSDPTTHMTRRGRGKLRGLLYMAALSGTRNNPRLAAYYDHLTGRSVRPLSKMAALGACMNKLLLYSFAVMKNRVPFDIDHRWKAEESEAA